MDTQTAGTMMRFGMPMASLAEAVLAARDAGEERLYLEVPLALVQGAIGAAVPEVAGHQWVAGGEEPIVLELDDDNFDVMGAVSARWEDANSERDTARPPALP